MRAIRDITVGELMSKPVVTVTPETTIEALTALMVAHDFNAFPVVSDAGALLGLVSRLDLFRLYLRPYARFIPSLEETWISHRDRHRGRHGRAWHRDPTRPHRRARRVKEGPDG